MTAFWAAAFFGLDLVAGNGVYPRLRQLLRHDEIDREQLRSLQNRLLVDTVVEAHKAVPHYRNSIRSLGTAPWTRARPGALADLPILWKRDLVAHSIQLRSLQFDSRRLLKRRTGGTTGTPVEVLLEPRANGWETAAYWRGCRWAGYKPGMPVLRLGGGSLGLGTTQRRHAVRRRFLNELVLPAFELRRDTIGTFASALRWHKPKVMIGYGSVLVSLADLLERAGIRATVPLIFPKAERLEPWMRERLSTFFQGEVFDGYGSGEANAIAHECPEHQGLHLSEDIYFPELIDTQGKRVSRRGILCLTTLRRRAMPLVRFATGDVVELSDAPCPCGRPYRLITEIEGREGDSLIRSDGTLVPPVFAPHLFRELVGVARGQLVQDRRDHVLVLLVPTPDADRIALRDAAWRAVSEHVRVPLVTVRLVDDVLNGDVGKFRAQKCLVGSVQNGPVKSGGSG